MPILVNDGFLVIDKPAGITSHDVVARIRRILQTRKVGHAGTLDPMATGVLVIGVNNGTRLLQYVTDGKKRYHATIKLGSSTVTDDREGEVIGQATRAEIAAVSNQQITDRLNSMVGKIPQRPSSVSAIKVDGKRGYDRVRAGEVVELPTREITIYSLKIKNIIFHEDGQEIEIDVQCSPGTYIRAIARDLGESVAIGGHLITLRRIEVDPFSMSDAKTLEEFENKPHLISWLEVARRLFPLRAVDFEEINELKFGRALTPSAFDGIGVAISSNHEICALIENKNDRAQPIAVFVKQ